MKYENYIFDLDGTLLNTIDDLAISCNEALKAYNMPTYTLDEVRGFVGNGVKKLLERTVPNGTDNPLFEETFAYFRQHYLAHGMDHTGPYGGIMDMLRQMKQDGKKVAVVSNKFCAATQELVAHYFGDLVDMAIGESKNVRKKPAPDMVLEVMHQLGATTDNTVYVGDSDVDIDTARNCTLPCISVLWGFRSKEFLLDHGAVTLASTPADILSI